MRHITIYLMTFFFSLPLFAYEYKCPDDIETTQALAKKVDGWSSLMDTMNGRQNFEYLQVYDGNPEEGASLIPNNEGSKNKAHWSGKTIKGFWIACFYRQSTIRLIQEIPKSVKGCSLKQKNILSCQ